MTFDTLGLAPQLLRALQDAAYTHPTDVQARAIPAAIGGRDLRVCSHTGSGKTAAFVLPALMRVLAARDASRTQSADGTNAAAPDRAPADARPARHKGRPPRRRDDHFGPPSGPRALVLAPTRELAMQVAKAAATYGRHVPGLRIATIVGGVPYGAQLQALRGPIDLMIATPGRLMDHMASGKARLGEVELLVLDEADRMLDLGFVEDIDHISAAIPPQRQTLMASATYNGAVGPLAARLLKPDALRIETAGHDEPKAQIAQQLLWADDRAHKAQLLEHMLCERDLQQAIVFTSTQRDADDLAQHLHDIGHAVAPLHGGMPQGRRTRTLTALRRGELRVLVATDVAARGIDVPTISHVINYGLPMKAEDYVHRIGRTGRAGRSGNAVTLAERRDVAMIQRIQHYTSATIPVSTVAGLEPRRPVPDLAPRRPAAAARPPGKGAPRRGAPGSMQRAAPNAASHHAAQPRTSAKPHKPAHGAAPVKAARDAAGQKPQPFGGKWPAKPQRGAAPPRGRAKQREA